MGHHFVPVDRATPFLLPPSLQEWLPEEIAMVEAIAEQLAQAAENIRLLDETQKRAAREQRVNEIGEQIRSAQSLEEALQIAVKEVGMSLKTPQTTIQFDVESLNSDE